MNTPEPGVAAVLPSPAATPAPRTRSRATARAAGKIAERLVVMWVRAQGAPYAEKRIAGARLDRGDVAGIPGVVIEVKCPGPGQPTELGPWIDEAIVERDNDAAAVALLVVKRRNRGSPADWYWITDGTTMAKLLRDAGWFAA